MEKKVEQEEAVKPTKVPRSTKKEDPSSTPSKPTTIAAITDLDDLRASVKKELESKAQERQKLVVDLVVDLWQEYSEKLDSAGAKTVLKSAVLTLDGSLIKASVGTQIARSTILQETSLLDHIREKTGHDDIMLNVIVDPALAPPDTGKRILTKEEIYKSMLAENPLLEEMMVRLNLKIIP